MKKRKNGFKGFRGVGKNPKREWEFGPTFAERPLRQIDDFFAELSDKGKELALRLKFGPVRTHGSAESLRAYPRGLPGTGKASRMTRGELQAAIEGLKIHIGVKAYI